MTLKNKIYSIIFHADTTPGKRFDLLLLWAILLSLLAVVLESVPQLKSGYSGIFKVTEWIFTILFSVEYFVRIYVSPKPLRYIFSFWGIVDFLASIPTYLTLVYSGAQVLIVVRLIRLLRVFRILKMARYTKEARVLISALKASMYKITIFFSSVLVLVLLLGTVMYVVEGNQEGFSSIPQSIYWAIVTITTVGYGDLVPQTALGKFISSVIMIIGYAIIAVPTGIVTVELSKKSDQEKVCSKCEHTNAQNAKYCSQCGNKLNVEL